MSSSSFQFQQFTLQQDQCAMKVGTDGVLLGSWASTPQPQRILDIGTGTGLIALMLAQRYPQAQVTGVEVDQLAAAQAKANINNAPFEARTHLVHTSIQTFAESDREPFDLIVSNPPFFSGGVISEQEGRANVRHTLKLSHQDLLRSVQRLLTSSGHFCVILPWLEGLRFVELAATYQLYLHQQCKVSPSPGKSPNRLLLQLGRSRMTSPILTEMAIYMEPGEGRTRSAAFADLTGAFYLR